MRNYSDPILNKKGKPLKLLEAAAHHCIRCIKKTRALRKLGYETHGIGNMMAYGTDEYDTYTTWKNERQLKNAIRMYVNNGIDIITWDNEPDIPVKWIRDVLKDMNREDVKLVVDLHDLDSIRRRFIPIEEREMFNSADALMYVSQPIQEKTNNLHKVTKPNIVLYSYCNKDIISYDEVNLQAKKDLVYEGGANPPDDVELANQYAYRSLYTIIKRLVEMGNETHMFCGNLSAYETYQNIGAVIHPPTEYNEMMSRLVKYKYGVLIFNNADGQKDQVNFTTTNKMWEYMMAGVASLACWCPESERLVEKHNIGFTFKHIDEIGNTQQLDDKYDEVIRSINIKRKELVMENFIWRVEQLYAKLLEVEGKYIPKDIRKISVFEYGKEDVNRSLKF